MPESIDGDVAIAGNTAQRRLRNRRGRKQKVVMIRIIAYAVATMVATLAVNAFSENLLSFESGESIVIFGLVAGVINAVIKPVVHVLTLPITCLTFGLFALVINMALFKGGAAVTPGIDVSWLGALAGSIVASLASGLIFSVIDD